MKIQRHKLLKIASSGAAGLAFATAVQASTTLTGVPGSTTNVAVPATHGSNAAATPNISVSWPPSGPDGWEQWPSRATTTNLPFSAWPSDPSEDGVYQFDDANANQTLTITLTPDVGFNAIFTNTDINAWLGGGDFIVDWAILGVSSGTLASGDNITIPDGSVTPLNFGDVTGVGSEALTLNLTINANSTGTGSYLAMDNLTFDQVAVPEASSVALAAIGIGAAGMRRRRRTRA